MTNEAWRSWLFVPGDSERKQAKATGTDADVLIYDLEDSVAPAAKENARKQVVKALGTSVRAPRRCVRINPVSSGLAEHDLRTVMDGRPDVIMVPKLLTYSELDKVDQWLAIRESELDIAPGTTRIVPLVTEVPAMTLELPGIRRWHERVLGLTWGAEDLATELGAARNRDQDGNWRPPYQLARSLTLMSARASDLISLDTIYADFGNTAGMQKYAEDAAADGFDGMLAIHPAQVSAINTAFTPSQEQYEWAQNVLAAFAADPDAGVVRLGTAMLDEPHRRQAQRIVERMAIARD